MGWRGRGSRLWAVLEGSVEPPDFERPLGPRFLLSSPSRHLFPGPRCEFSLSPGPLPPRGSRTPSVPLHHQLYAGRSHHTHTHLHCLLHDSCTAPGTHRQGHGWGTGGRAVLQGWEGRPRLGPSDTLHVCPWDWTGAQENRL